MTVYGKTAVLAVRSYQKDGEIALISAWNQAIAIYTTSPSSRTKACPREAFMGLCHAGLVAGIPPTHRAAITKNGRYAIEAVKLLQKLPQVAMGPTELWRRVVGEGKQPNGQMGVVLALRRAGLIIGVTAK
jgi:hypothetical protein